MLLFVLSVVFVFLMSLFVAREMRQDRVIVFMILLVLFSAMKFKKQMKMDEIKFINGDQVELVSVYSKSRNRV